MWLHEETILYISLFIMYSDCRKYMYGARSLETSCILPEMAASHWQWPLMASNAEHNSTM